MAFRLDFHPEAALEFEEAVSWYEEQRLGLGRDFFEEFLELQRRLEENPYQFTTVLEEIRRANFVRFPYSVFFSIEQNVSIIYAVFHQKRNPVEWENRL
jgi:plasmid stabilization system protein ParE